MAVVYICFKLHIAMHMISFMFRSSEWKGDTSQVIGVSLMFQYIHNSSLILEVDADQKKPQWLLVSSSTFGASHLF